MHLLNDLKAFLEQQALTINVLAAAPHNATITNLYTDSRQVTQGSIFIALSNENDYIKKALALGAAGILTNQPLDESALSKNSVAFIWQVAELTQQLPSLAKWFYGEPSTQLKLIGITGTNGKTSTAFYTAQLLSQLTTKPVGIIGTLGNGVVHVSANTTPKLQIELTPSPNTTPDVINLNRVLSEFVAQGLETVVMEVSSHGLVLQRIAGLIFNSAALTQVTRDHLDFHLTEEAYREAKQLFFTDYFVEHRIINLDDSVGQKIAQLRANDVSCLGYSLNGHPQAKIQLKHLQLNHKGLQFELSTAQQIHRVQCGLMGRFNAENLACAISICDANGFDLAAISQACEGVQPVLGRMETVRQKPWVLVDYAHTPDALEQALKAVRQHMSDLQMSGDTAQKLWVVFGCGGNRDQGKRALMGRVAQTYADAVVLTDDNPRCEASYDILNDILGGFDVEHTVQPQLIPDRKTAIEFALAQAHSQDLVLIAGKGHETYQTFCDEQTYFSDQTTAKEWSRQ